MEVEGQFHVGSHKDEPGPTGKMMKHSTSTRLLKTLGRIEAFTIAFSHPTLLKEYIEKRRVDNFHFHQQLLHTKKKEGQNQNGSNDTNLSVTHYDDTMVAASQSKNVTK